MVQVCCEEIPSRHLARFGKFKNQMERSYYETRYACQLDAFAKALNVRPKLLEKYIKKQ